MENQPGVPVPSQAQPSAAVYAYWMSVTPGRVRGAVSNFREGSITLSPAGVLLDGKTLISTGMQVLVLVVGGLFCVGLLGAAVLIEYALRVRGTQQLAWDDVEEIVLVPVKNRACLVYHTPDRPRKPQSLAFRLQPDLHLNFIAAANYLAPGKVREGKIGGTTTPTQWAVLAVIILAVIVLVAVAAIYGGK